MRLEAKAVHDAARTSLSRFSNDRPDLLESLKEPSEAILDWSIEKCAQYRDESYGCGQTRAAGITVRPAVLPPASALRESHKNGRPRGRPSLH